MMLSPQPLWQHSKACTHDLRVAYAFERKIHASIREVDNCLNRVVDVIGVDEIRHAKALRQGLTRAVQIDADNALGPGQTSALNDIEANAPKPKTATVAPASTFAVFITAPIPVVTPQPM